MKYIYGIINGSRPDGTVGIQSQVSIFLNDTSIQTISYDGISAVVSDAEKVDLNLVSKQTLAQYLLKHQQVIEKVMENCSILPIRLGTYAENEDEVKQILSKGFSLIKDIFKQVADKIEIDVVATWSRFEQVLKEIGEEPEIREFKQKLKASPKGVTVDDQMKVGVMVKRAMDEKRKKISAHLQEILRSISQHCRSHEAMDDRMVLNCAFLIEKAKREYFDKKIEELNTEFAEKLNFRCVGPLPPYSFYTLEVSKLKSDEIEWAKQKLRLQSDQISEDEVKRAYKRSAQFSHPDIKGGGEKEFEDIVKAYKLLWDYSRAGNDTLLVKVREN